MGVWSVFRRRPHRSGAPISPILVVVLSVLLCAVSVAFWQAVLIETRLTVAGQIDYEDAALCNKLGFALGTAKHDGCKLDLLDLRHRHEDLMAQSSLP